jgi:hypothetical protein
MDFVLNINAANVIISPNEIDVSSSVLTLYGYGTKRYGQQLQQNLLDITSHFNNYDHITTPLHGMLWYQSELRIYDNSKWRHVITINEDLQQHDGNLFLQYINNEYVWSFIKAYDNANILGNKVFADTVDIRNELIINDTRGADNDILCMVGKKPMWCNVGDALFTGTGVVNNINGKLYCMDTADTLAADNEPYGVVHLNAELAVSLQKLDPVSIQSSNNVGEVFGIDSAGVIGWYTIQSLIAGAASTKTDPFSSTGLKIGVLTSNKGNMVWSNIEPEYIKPGLTQQVLHTTIQADGSKKTEWCDVGTVLQETKPYDGDVLTYTTTGDVKWRNLGNSSTANKIKDKSDGMKKFMDLMCPVGSIFFTGIPFISDIDFFAQPSAADWLEYWVCSTTWDSIPEVTRNKTISGDAVISDNDFFAASEYKSFLDGIAALHKVNVWYKVKAYYQSTQKQEAVPPNSAFGLDGAVKIATMTATDRKALDQTYPTYKFWHVADIYGNHESGKTTGNLIGAGGSIDIQIAEADKLKFSTDLKLPPDFWDFWTLHDRVTHRYSDGVYHYSYSLQKTKNYYPLVTLST